MSTPELYGLVAVLKARNILIATAESCTGGLIASRITEVPGASDVFWGSVVSYANEAKVELLGVPDALIAKHGAVSDETSRSMAAGLQNRIIRSISESVEFGKKTTAVVSTTGIAGPSGGSPEKPVGLCWIGVAVAGPGTQQAQVFSKKILAPSGLGRRDVQSYFAAEAIGFLSEKLAIGD